MKTTKLIAGLAISLMTTLGITSAKAETWTGSLTTEPQLVFTELQSIEQLDDVSLSGKMGGASMSGIKPIGEVVKLSNQPEDGVVYQFQINDYNHASDCHLKYANVKFTQIEGGIAAAQIEQGYILNGGPTYIGTEVSKTTPGWNSNTIGAYNIVEIAWMVDEKFEATIEGDTTWTELWPDGVPTAGSQVTLTIADDAELTMDVEASVGLLTLIGEHDLTIAYPEYLSVGTLKINANFTGQVIYKYDATAGFTASAELLSAIKAAPDNISYLFDGGETGGATLDFGTECGGTLRSHIIFKGGISNTMTYGNAYNGLSTTSTQEKPVIWVTGNAILAFTAHDLTQWSGGYIKGGVIRVDDGSTLNLYNDRTFFYRQQFYLEPGAQLNVADGQTVEIHGGSASDEIYVPDSEAGFDKPAIISGNVRIRDGEGGTEIGAYVGENSKLEIQSLAVYSEKNCAIVKRGKGEIAFTTSVSPKIGVTISEGVLDLRNATVLTDVTVTNDTIYDFPEGTDEDQYVSICTGMLISPTKLLDKEVYVGGEKLEGTHTLAYGENSVAYSSGLPEDYIEDEEVTIDAINALFDQTITEDTDVVVKLTSESDSVKIFFQEGDELFEHLTKVFIVREGDLILDIAPGCEELLEKFDFSGVTGNLLAGYGVISVNFDSGRGKFPETDEADGMLAGGTPKLSWNNVSGAAGNTTAIKQWDTLVNAASTLKGAEITWNANTTYGAGQDVPILNGYLDDGGSGTVITISNLPYKMYDIIVYLNTDMNERMYNPIEVNTIPYTWDASEGKTVIGSDDWGATTRSGVEYGQNALRIADVKGNSTIHLGVRNDGAKVRNCICAMQIVQVPYKDYKNTYDAQEGEDVTISTLNEYVKTGDPYTGAVTLNLKGGDLILDADFDCSGLAINSTGDVSIKTDGSYIPSEEAVAKISQGDIAGVFVWDLPLVDGKYCWIDYEFNGDLKSVGKDASPLARDGDNGKYLYGDEPISDFRPVVGTDPQEYDALYAGSHPYRSISWPKDFACAMYGTLPEVDQSCLFAFGSTTAGTVGGIALMTGKTADNQVLLVRWTGTDKYEVMAEMSVPNAYTTSHLYIFSKTGNTIKVYLDGSLWTTYTSETDFAMGSGFQICSVHGGVFNTGINRFYPGSFVDGIDDPRCYTCVIDTLRLYNFALGQAAINQLKEEFPYESPAGNFSRRVDGAEEWVADAAWSDGESDYAEPKSGAVLEIEANGESSLAINLAENTVYESITFEGAGSLAIAKADDAQGMVVNGGKTVVGASVTIKYGAMTISGGPTFIEEAGSLVFDFTDYPFEKLYGNGFIQLTGLMESPVTEEKFRCILPDDTCGRKVECVYDTSSKTYHLNYGIDREPTTLYLPEGTTEPVVINGETIFVDGDGAEQILYYSEDKVMLRAGETAIIEDTLPLNNFIIACEAGEGRAKVVFDLMDDFEFAGKIDGAIQVEKTGEGALLLSNENTFTGGIEAKAGSLKMGNPKCLGPWYENDEYASIVIDEGAVFDINGTSNGGSTSRTYEITFMNGSKYTNTGKAFSDRKLIGISKITLEGDMEVEALEKSTIGLSLHYNSNGVEIDLGEWTLTKTGKGDFIIGSGAQILGTGTLVIEEGGVITQPCSNGAKVTAAEGTIIFNEGTTYNAESYYGGRGFVAKNLVFNGEVISTEDVEVPVEGGEGETETITIPAGDIKVTGALSGSGKLAGLEMGEGATINVGEAPITAYAAAFAETLNVTGVAAGDTVMNVLSGEPMYMPTSVTLDGKEGYLLRFEEGRLILDEIAPAKTGTIMYLR